MQENVKYTKELKQKLNEDLKNYFPHLFLVDETMEKSFTSVSRLILLDRYAQKDINHISYTKGDLVLCVIKEDPKFPARGIGYIDRITKNHVYIKLEEEYVAMAEDANNKGIIKRKIGEVDKPLELYYEQVCQRVANNLSIGETLEVVQALENELKEMNIIPAGRVLFGAGSNTAVTYFNCFVMPYIHDSRGGISRHRKEVMEIMSRGGGVGTNGSTLRPRNALAKGVSGKSSGSVSWLNDLSSLTNLVEQGGSRRGAQMIMLADWHPDILEFIISKMQNPKILLFLIENLEDEDIRRLAKDKLKFTHLSREEIEIYETIVKLAETNPDLVSKLALQKVKDTLNLGGTYSVNNPDFLSGANISVAITKEFMYAVENDLDYALKFPDTDDYSLGEKAAYNEKWQACGDVREWEKMGYRVKTYRTIKARELWHLICICATYSAEPGIFFIDNANDMTNAKAYGQKVVCTNPCGEQPLAPYSVCNLAALNLANMYDWDKRDVNWDKLENSIRVAVRMQDNVIDQTTYFLEANEKQAKGERRVGLGVMGLHDLIIYADLRYGSKEGNKFVDKVFKFIATTAYDASIDLAKEKGSFPFLDQYGSREKFIETGYMKNMPQKIRNDVLKYGIRNSHLLTIAPTGSTGTMVGVSTGLEPYFAFKYYRSGRLGQFMEVNAPVIDIYLSHNPEYSYDNLPDVFVSAMGLTAEEHADTQCVIQKWVDSSISKTVNAPKGYTVEDVESLYFRLYKGGAKGGTVYVDGSRDSQVLTLTKEDKLPKQVGLEDLGIEITESKSDVKSESTDSLNQVAPLKANREIGVEVGNLCPICHEGIVEDIGGCNTCTNCSAQLKCDI